MSELRVVSSVIRDPVPVPDSSARYPSEEEDLALGLLALALDEDGDEAGSAACAVPEVSSDQENVEPDGDGVSRSMRIRDLDRSSWEAGPVLADITHNVEEVLRRRRRRGPRTVPGNRPVHAQPTIVPGLVSLIAPCRTFAR